MNKIRIGLMGLGQVGRQIFKLAMESDRFEVVAISDIGHRDILTHLLNKTLEDQRVQLQDNYLVGNGVRARLMTADHPTEIPWDVFNVDTVIDATGKFRSRAQLTPHLGNGAARVIASTLPDDEIDRVILFGINENSARTSDRVISAGSASTTAAALALKILGEKYKICHASMTSVHAYTSDQSLQDYAGADYRRSRSGAENIIPNLTPALTWIQRTMPEMKDKVTAYALNVPVQTGSMLDITVSLEEAGLDADAIKNLYIEAATNRPGLVQVTNDPIVSSDVRGSRQSLLVDLQGSMRAGKHIFKLLAWHETLGHANRILDVANHYHTLSAAEGARS